jgi:hypothetical protein
MIPEVALHLIPQPSADGQVGPQAPIVIQKHPGINLAYSGGWNSGAQAELPGTEAELLYLRAGVAGLLQRDRFLILRQCEKRKCAGKIPA